MKPKDFKTECVEHLAKSSCNCQCSAPDVEQNTHYQSCMVGKAQRHLGKKVTNKLLWSMK